jgi:thiamine biosynthesis lipoprotein
LQESKFVNSGFTGRIYSLLIIFIPPMDLRKKNLLYSLLLLAVMFVVYKCRQENSTQTAQIPQLSIEGSTMGTIYHIKYIDTLNRDMKAGVDSLLVAFNQSLSTYIPESEISSFNTNNQVKYQSTFFYPVLQKSKEVYENTGGAFDPTIMPLVNAWGFGPGKNRNPDSSTVAGLVKLVGFKNIAFNSQEVRKLKEGIQLDMSAIAKGYGVDVVAQYLNQHNIDNYMVEIGGEVICKGTNKAGQIWKIGIDNPDMDKGENPVQAIVRLENRALATSGNYRNFYEKDDRKYSHTLSPTTGYPVEHGLLSASVFANDCMTADAYATAFMVMGTEKAIELSNKLDIDVFLIYNDEQGQIKTYTSESIKKHFETAI